MRPYKFEKYDSFLQFCIYERLPQNEIYDAAMAFHEDWHKGLMPNASFEEALGVSAKSADAFSVNPNSIIDIVRQYQLEIDELLKKIART